MSQLSPHKNNLGQPIGAPVPDWQSVQMPPRMSMQGRYCRLEPIDPAVHGVDLYAAYALDKEGRIWTYLPYGPFNSFESYRGHLEYAASSADPMYYAIIDESTGKAVGGAAYLRIDPKSGSIEVGGLCYSTLLQRTPAATEAMFLMMQRIFELGYRRYEWKCNSLNAPSRAAAQRLGFSYEGTHRQAWVVKGRNRDTSWYSIIDSEWPALHQAFTRWLDPGNFDEQGKQKVRLSTLTRPTLKTIG